MALATALLLALGAAACGNELVVWDGNRPLLGDWNGRHVSMALAATGGAVEFDCAHGGLDAPLIPDASGRFSVRGVHVLEHGGPIRADEVPDSLPALYFGSVQGGVLTLRVVVRGDTLGPYTLRRDARRELFKCL